MRSEELLEKKDLRDGMVDKISVLNKVKGLLLLPNTEYATTEQVAGYYKVGKEAVSSLVHDNREEIESDGYKVVKGKEIVKSYVISFKDFTSDRANYKFILQDGKVLSVGGKGISLFPKRAILRVGMLLRDSEVAKEIRTQLLNLEEKTTEEQKVIEIEEKR